MYLRGKKEYYRSKTAQYYCFGRNFLYSTLAGKTDLHTLIRPAFGFSKTHPPCNRSLWLSFPLHASEKNSLEIKRFLFWIDAKNCVSKYKHSRASSTSIFSDGALLYRKQKNLKTLELMGWRRVTFENVKRWTSFKIRIH